MDRNSFRLDRAVFEPQSFSEDRNSPATPLSRSGQNCLEGKRVGMVSFSPYPADPRPRRAAEALLREGMKVDMICLGEDGLPKRESLNGLNILRMPMRRWRGGKLSYAYQYSAFTLLSGLMFALRSLKGRYDLIYVHNMPDVLVLSSLVPKMLGAKVVLDLHDPMPELMMTIFNLDRNSMSVQVLHGLERWSTGRADLVLTVNSRCKQIFAARSCAPEKIGVVMNAPDGDIFPLRQSGSDRSVLHPDNRPFVIMYHGSIVERNGLDLAVESLSWLRDVLPVAELRIYGASTPFLERVMKDAGNRGVEGMVRYLGPRRLDDLPKEIEQCHVGIVPNHRNAFTNLNMPTRIFEYLALGKPVVAPRTAGVLDYFDERSLILFDPGNAEDLARKIAFSASHTNDVMETTRRGQQIYLNHTWDREREVFVDLVTGLFAKTRGNSTHP